MMIIIIIIIIIIIKIIIIIIIIICGCSIYELYQMAYCLIFVDKRFQI
jgi:hypothetical protein